MTRLEILRSVMISGEPVQAGSLVEIGNSEAFLLVGMGKARIASEPEASAPVAAEEAPKRGRKATQPVFQES